MKPSSVIIVGAGPAGLFAALELSATPNHPPITIIEQGHTLKDRPATDAMKGVGGGGTFSDGKLHFTPVLSHEKLLDLIPIEEYQSYLDQVDQMFTDFGARGKYTPANMADAENLVTECQKKGIKLYIRRCKHVGSDQLPTVVQNIVNLLESRGVEIICDTEVEEIVVKNNRVIDLKINKNGEISFFRSTANAKSPRATSPKVARTAKNDASHFAYLIAPGRIGASWLRDQAKKIGLSYTPEQIEIGVRVEFPASVMKRHSDILHENIYSIVTPTFGDIVRTFCPCPNGSVAVENYQDFVCVNGFSNANSTSPNSNFNFTTPIILTNPTEDTTTYATLIAKLANLLGDGKPILQRLEDLRTGHRSTWEKLQGNKVTPSLTDVTPGDIALALPHRIVKNLKEGLQILDHVLPGINDGSTLLYAPEIKLRGNRIKVDQYLQTQVENLFVAGDGAGTSGNIVGAAISGIIAAKGIFKTQLA